MKTTIEPEVQDIVANQRNGLECTHCVELEVIEINDK